MKKIIRNIVESTVNLSSVFFYGKYIPTFFINVVDSIRCTLLRREIKKRNLKIFDASDLNKQSNVLFIFGGGESIASLDDDDWSLIKKHDSAALNYFYVHEFKPNYLFVELNDDACLVDLFKDYCLNAEGFSDTKIVMQYKHARKTSLFSGETFLNEPSSYVPKDLKAFEEDDLRALIKGRRRATLNNLIHHSSHVGAVVDFALLSNYEEIVLVGVDLNGGKYFYDVESSSNLYRNNEKYESLSVARKRYFDSIGEGELDNHQSMNRELTNKYKSIDIYRYFKIVNEIYPNRIKVFNKCSKLSDIFDVYSK
ncbi:hypothetical protein [Vibrio diabolicus]|uniref:hypothetical protein n=1 Tax=Vibrio diabolicus TaxID=50719 RepID=UPI00375234E9